MPRSYNDRMAEAEELVDGFRDSTSILESFLEYVSELKEDLDRANKDIDSLEDEKTELLEKIEKLEKA